MTASCTGPLRPLGEIKVDEGPLLHTVLPSAPNPVLVLQQPVFCSEQSQLLWSLPFAIAAAALGPLAPLGTAVCWGTYPMGLMGARVAEGFFRSSQIVASMCLSGCNDIYCLSTHEDLSTHREATGVIAPALSPVEAAVAQYAIAAGQSTVPMPVAPDPQQMANAQNLQQYTFVPAPPAFIATNPGLQYPGAVLGPTGNPPPVATHPLASAAAQPMGSLGSAPTSPSMIGTLAVDAGGSASLGLQGLGAGVPHTYPQVPPTVQLPSGFPSVGYPGATALPAMGNVPSKSTYSAQQQAAAAAALFGVPVRVAPPAGVLGGVGPFAAGMPPAAGVPPGPEPQGVVVGQSATPIADSVLLGHMLGDNAAPPPNAPLPVVAPLAPTSGLMPEQVP